MTRSKKILLGTVAAAGLGWGAMAATGFGTQTLNTAKLELISEAAASQGGYREGRHGRGHGGHDRMMRMCGPQRAEKLEDGIGLVEAFFSFNDAQKTAWTGLTAALRESSDAIGNRCEAMKDADRPQTATDKLARAEGMLTTGLEIVRKVRPAFEGFYATLDPKQQAALDKLIQHRGRWGQGAHGAERPDRR